MHYLWLLCVLPLILISFVILLSNCELNNGHITENEIRIKFEILANNKIPCGIIFAIQPIGPGGYKNMCQKKASKSQNYLKQNKFSPFKIRIILKCSRSLVKHMLNISGEREAAGCNTEMLMKWWRYSNPRPTVKIRRFLWILNMSGVEKIEAHTAV